MTAEAVNYDHVSARLARQIIEGNQRLAGLRAKRPQLALAVEEGKAKPSQVAELKREIRELEDDLAAKESALIEARRLAGGQRAKALADRVAANRGRIDAVMVERIGEATEIQRLVDELAARCNAYDERGRAAHGAVSRFVPPDVAIATAPAPIAAFVIAQLIHTAGWREMPGIEIPGDAIGTWIKPGALDLKLLATSERERLIVRLSP